MGSRPPLGGTIGPSRGGNHVKRNADALAIGLEWNGPVPDVGWESDEHAFHRLNEARLRLTIAVELGWTAAELDPAFVAVLAGPHLLRQLNVVDTAQPGFLMDMGDLIALAPHLHAPGFSPPSAGCERGERMLAFRQGP